MSLGRQVICQGCLSKNMSLFYVAQTILTKIHLLIQQNVLLKVAIILKKDLVTLKSLFPAQSLGTWNYNTNYNSSYYSSMLGMNVGLSAELSSEKLMIFWLTNALSTGSILLTKSMTRPWKMESLTLIYILIIEQGDQLD